MTSKAEEPINPNEHLQIPEWINENYFLGLLKRDIPDFVAIRNFRPIAATATGENYTSVMVRVEIDVATKECKSRQTNYILKTMLDDSTKGSSVVKEMNLFPKEVKMYTTYVPGFEQLYKKAGWHVQLAPKCLHVEQTPERTTLIMEDLKRRGFKNANRLLGFDMAHMTRVLHKLAELHAASAVYYELNGPFDPCFDRGTISEVNRDLFVELNRSRHEALKQAILEYDLENPKYYNQKLLMPEVLCDEAIKLNIIDATEFNVLNHGDCWVNNIMFNYKANDEIDEILLVDLQICKWGSPALDLWYFIIGSASVDIKVSKFDEFIQIYHEHLVKCLSLLKYKKPLPTLSELHIMMLKYSLWGVVTATGFMCSFLLSADKDANIDTILTFGPEGDEFRRKSFCNPYFSKALTQLLPFFDRKGIL